MKATPLQRLRERVRTTRAAASPTALIAAADDQKLLELVDAMRALRVHSDAVPQGREWAVRGNQWKIENGKLQKRVLRALDSLEGKH